MLNHSGCSTGMLKLHTPAFVSLILGRLKQAGHQAFIVGGAVRDACMQKPIIDWDVATSAPPGKIKAIFGDKSLFSLKHGTVTLVHGDCLFEVTAFRGRQNTLEHDLACRDFTINAMAYDPDRDEILDPHGAKQDIARRLVRAVGDPEARFKEDPLRLLRAVRFATELGFRIEAETRKSLCKMAPFITAVAPERVRDELLRVLMTPKPSAGFNLMLGTGLLEYFLPELSEGNLKRQNAFHRYTIFRHVMETIDQVKPVPVLRLTALFHDIAKPRVREKIGGKWHFYGHEGASAKLAEEVMVRLKFSKDIIRKTTNLIRHHMIYYDSGWSDAAVRRLIRRAGPKEIADLLDFRLADILAHGLHGNDLNLLTELDQRVRNLSKGSVVTETGDLAIDGREVMQILGLSPGPEVGKVLNYLLEKITDHPELNNQKGLLDLLGQMKSN
jgi:tRNA nucleotidyltransferase (CCA-adding enzyme)